MREILRRAGAEPLAGIMGWVLVASGWALWMAVQVPLPGFLDGLCALDAWTATTLGGPLVVLSEMAKRKNGQGAER